MKYPIEYFYSKRIRKHLDLITLDTPDWVMNRRSEMLKLVRFSGLWKWNELM